MILSKKSIYWVPFMALLYLLVYCGGDPSIELKKEKVLYRNRIDSTLTKIERKLTVLETQYAPADSITQKMDSANVDELTKPDKDVEPAGMIQMDLGNMREELKRKRAQIDLVPDEDWQQLKREIDQLIARYERVAGARDSLRAR